jgi:hypothetical protein
MTFFISGDNSALSLYKQGMLCDRQFAQVGRMPSHCTAGIRDDIYSMGEVRNIHEFSAVGMNCTRQKRRRVPFWSQGVRRGPMPRGRNRFGAQLSAMARNDDPCLQLCFRRRYKQITVANTSSNSFCQAVIFR